MMPTTGNDLVRQGQTIWREYISRGLEYEYFTLPKLLDIAQDRGLHIGLLTRSQVIAGLRAADRAEHNKHQQAGEDGPNVRLVGIYSMASGVPGQALRAWRVDVTLEGDEKLAYWIPLEPTADERTEVVALTEVVPPAQGAGGAHTVQISLVRHVPWDRPEPSHVILLGVGHVLCAASDVFVDIVVQDISPGMHSASVTQGAGTSPAMPGTSGPPGDPIRLGAETAVGSSAIPSAGKGVGTVQTEQQKKKRRHKKPKGREIAPRGATTELHSPDEIEGVEVSDYFEYTVPFILPACRKRGRDVVSGGGGGGRRGDGRTSTKRSAEEAGVDDINERVVRTPPRLGFWSNARLQSQIRNKRHT